MGFVLEILVTIVILALIIAPCVFFGQMDMPILIKIAFIVFVGPWISPFILLVWVFRVLGLWRE